MLVVVLFLAVFTTVALLLLVVSTGRANEGQQVLARLDAIGVGPKSPNAEEETFSIRREEKLSGIAALDALLQRLDIAQRLRLILYQADLNWTPGKLIIMSSLVALVSGYLIYLRTDGVMLGLLVGCMVGATPFLYVFRNREKRFDGMRERLPEALDLMVSAIRAGHSFYSSMGMAAKESPEPVKREFRQCYDEQSYGLDLRVAMTNLAHRMPIREVRMIATAILIQKETGGNLTEILEKTAVLIREDFRLQRQVRVHTAQGRLTGWILTFMPVILGFLMYMVNPEHMSLLWRRSIGVRMMEGAAVMTVIGGLIIRKIIRIRI
jgi:tight adherence protein B